MGLLSYEFETADRTRVLWDPSLTVGRLYVSLAQEAGGLLGLATGLAPNERGGADVDLDTFQAFAQGLYDAYCSTSNFIMHELLRGLLVSSLVLLKKGGGTVARDPEQEAGLLDKHDAYMRAMWVED